MARTLRERWRESPGQQVAEQLLGHLVGIGGIPVAIVLGFAAWGVEAWPVYAGLCASLWTASVREFIDGLPIESWGDALLDWAFSVLGGPLVGLVFWLVVF